MSTIDPRDLAPLSAALSQARYQQMMQALNTPPPTVFSPFDEAAYGLYLSSLAAEKRSLVTYIADLEAFVVSPFYATLSETERTLASNQIQYMKEYLHHLDQRIKRPQ